ncbi:hypothetical protein AAVH_39672, partial [Aphelenchoides avenae]
EKLRRDTAREREELDRELRENPEEVFRRGDDQYSTKHTLQDPVDMWLDPTFTLAEGRPRELKELIKANNAERAETAYMLRQKFIDKNNEPDMTEDQMSPWLAGLAFRRPLVVDPKAPVDYDAEEDDKPAEGKTLERLLTTYWPIAMNQLARSFKSVPPAHDIPPEIIEEYFETWVEGQEDSPQEADSPGGSSPPSVKSQARSPKEEHVPSTSGAAIAEAAAKVAKTETFGVPPAAAAVVAEPVKPTALVLPQPQVRQLAAIKTICMALRLGDS